MPVASLPLPRRGTGPAAAVAAAVLSAALLATTLLASLPAAAQSPFPEHNAARPWVGVDLGPTPQAPEGPLPVVMAAERRAIHAWFGTAPAARVALLPQGIRSAYARGAVLPAGTATQDLPQELLAALAERAEHRFVVVDSEVLLLDPEGVVLDVVYGAL